MPSLVRFPGFSLVAFGVVGLVATGCGSTDSTDSLAVPSSTQDGGPSNTLAIVGNDGGSSDGGRCEPPDVLILLDRTLTMRATPDGAEPTIATLGQTKFAQAMAAIKAMVAAPADETIRFGLEMWPRDPGKSDKGDERCDTLAEIVNQSNIVTNASCEGPTIDVSPALKQAAAIQSKLDPNTARLCFSTPTGAALQGAVAELARIHVAGRAQYIVLVTDGADWDLTCPTPDPRGVVVTAAAAGIGTYVVGFDARADAGISTGVGKAFLNDMACAGHTATDFAKNCHAEADGGYRANDPNGALLFLRAGSGQELTSALHGAASTVCCNCVR